MMAEPSRHRWLAAACAALLPTLVYGQSNVVHGDLFDLTNTSSVPTGAWSWFSGARAVIDPNAPGGPLLMVGSVTAGDGSVRGDNNLLYYNLQTGAQGSYELHNQLQQDDHDSAALLILPDGRYVASYSRHSADNLTRVRISTNPHDPTSWGPEQTVNAGAAATYSNLYYLPNDNNGAGRTYDFTRSVNWDPNVLVSNDQGATWSYGGKLLTQGDGSQRPYTRFASDGQRIYVTTTEQHPRDYATSVYSGYVQDGKLYSMTGAVLDADIFAGSAAAPASLTPVFTSGTVVDGKPMSHAWTIDMAVDAAGRPVTVFTARANGSTGDHRFFYGVFDGSTWDVHELAAAGASLYASEEDYTGLAALDPSDPNTVFISTRIDPRSSVLLAHYEIFEGVTPDGGADWQWSALTENSTMDNIRPVVASDGADRAVLWLRGTYNAYTSWNTQVVGVVQAVPEPGSCALLVMGGLLALGWRRGGGRGGVAG